MKLYNNIQVKYLCLTNIYVKKYIAQCIVNYIFLAFATWLFGTMFYLTCMPSSSVVLSNSIEVQACMLRILSRHHRTMFQTISSEYLNIFDGM